MHMNPPGVLTQYFAPGPMRTSFEGRIGRMASSGELGSLLNSRLGDGANASISADGILGLLGEDKLAGYAGQIGASTGEWQPRQGAA